MNKAEQIEFFLHCQKLLVEFHPTSSFIWRQSNTPERLHYVKTIVQNYKGFCYMDENVGVLYNRIVATGNEEPAQIIKSHMYKEPDANYNAAIIDFVTFKELKDCLAFVKTSYDPRVQKVLYVKHGQIKMFPTVQLISQLLGVPIV